MTIQRGKKNSTRKAFESFDRKRKENLYEKEVSNSYLHIIDVIRNTNYECHSKYNERK